MKQFIKSSFSYINRLNFGVKVIGFAFIFVGIVIILDYDKRRNNRVESQNDLVEIAGTLMHNPYISKGRTGGSVSIYLNEYPDYVFLLRNWRFAAFQAMHFINDCKVGDSVQMEISKRDYASKISKSEKLRFSQKILELSVIEPYSVKRDGFKYLTFKDAIDASAEYADREIWFVLFVSAIVIALIVIYAILKFSGCIAWLEKWFPMD
jgi:phosphoribosylformylglycinamidine (FGAM) synthase PurS component